MENTSCEKNRARAILNTYQQINDNISSPRVNKTSVNKRNKELLQELHQLKEKYLVLQNELMHRDKKLDNLNKELNEKTSYMTQLQEDFENAIYQLSAKKE